MKGELKKTHLHRTIDVSKSSEIMLSYIKLPE